MNPHVEYILNNTTPPKWMGTNLHYVTIMGSVAYGCNNNEGERSSKVSDLDLYGFCMPPKHIIFPHLHGHIRGFGKEPENFEQFQQHLKTKCMYETIYDDSEGVPILVIRELNAFAMVNRLLEAERERAALKAEELGMIGYGTLAIAAAIRKGDQE